ncbi:lipopolysaccharide biosynthesis protein [Roseateles sp. LKC17W]|uniref:Lipopolysaccharide biosynthesis protein n=1 Tax=Pelomonas margarita TaxID=3299031 RepID=A0ABW7FQ08_9BURK
MVGGFLFVLMGNVLRLGAGLLVIVLLARALGPEGFGTFAYALALASMAIVLLNFGLGTAVLRQFGANPGGKPQALAEALTAKLLLLAPLLLASLLGVWLMPGSARLVFAALLLAQVAESFSETYQLAFRAGSKFKDEAHTASVAAVLHIGVMAAAVWASPEALHCAGAFLLSRCLGLALTMRAAQRAYQPLGLSSVGAAWRCLRSAWAYAVEFALSTANTQLDSVLIQGQLGVRAVGLYQAGMKLVQGVSRLAPILALYLLPRLTRGVQAGSSRQSLLTLGVFGTIGVAAGAVLALGAGPLTRLLFGAGFADLAALLPWFGLLLALRFVETGAGLVLVAANLQRIKVWLVALQLLVLVGGGLWALAHWGLLGWLWVAIGSTVLLLALYAGLWVWHRRAGRAVEG